MYPELTKYSENRLVEANGMLPLLAMEKSKMAPDQPELSVYEAIVDGLIKSIIATACLGAKPSQNHPHGFGCHSWSIADTGLRLIKLCYSVGCQVHVPSVLNRILLPIVDCDTQKQIEDVVIPLLPQLKTFLLSKNQTITDEPYASFAAKAIKEYVMVVLGPKPEEAVTVSIAQLNTVGCNKCWYCERIRKFFLGEDKMLSIGLGPEIRTHLEKELATLVWGVTLTTIDSTTSQTLQITKTDTLMASIVWAKKQATGLKLVESVGDEATLQKILGSQFWTVASALDMQVTVQQDIASALTPVQAQTLASNAQGSSAGPSRLPDNAPATNKRPSTDGNQHPKRTKLDDDIDMIDLTN